MSAVRRDSQSLLTDAGPVDVRSYASAILNILEDAADERAQIQLTQKAILNILDDSSAEKASLLDSRRASINILEDAADERALLQLTQKAILNLLDDSSEEKASLFDSRRASLNILEDFDVEKKEVERINADLRNEVAKRQQVEDALRSANASAEGANMELEAFSYSVAHDLRAPLRSIDGFSQALLEDCADQLDADGSRYLLHVREAAQQMGKLIDDLLNLSRVTRDELRREPVNVSELARSVITRLRQSQPSREVELVVHDGLIAQCDPRLIDIVLTNLLGNAWKFTSKRQYVRIEFAAMLDVHPTVYFVRDNGAGFDAKYVDKLFGVFQRLHTTREFEGNGIGLATVRRIVIRHGGRVWAEGEVDKGATIYFTLEERQT
jgi:signal transduction histidine kinase